MRFQEKLYQLRKDRKMSQEDLADIVGVSRQAVQKWEAGLSNPDMDNLVAISNYFGVSIDNLIKDSEEVKAEETKTGETKAEETKTVQVEGNHIGLYYSLRMNYEYTSKRQLFGLPLVHINIGHGMRKAKGIIAIGNIAVGLISIGLLAAGVVSFGVLAFGLLVFAAFGLGGAVFAAIAAGIIAVGGIAIGVLAIGGVAIGIYSLGGFAIASRIALGGFANGYIAIGDKVNGAYTIYTSSASDKVRSLILQEYPKLWKPIVDLFTGFCNAAKGSR